MKKVDWHVPAIIVLLIILVVLNIPNNSIEKEFSAFAKEKALSAKTLEGCVVYQQDTVFFSFIPDVSFSVNGNDYIIIKTNKGVIKFTRYMLNDHNIPNPTGKGKAMRSWKRSFGGQEIMSDKKCMNIFKRVLKNGKTYY